VKNDTFSTLIATLRSASWEYDSVGLAEALWLARFLPKAQGSDAHEMTDAALRPADGKIHRELNAKQPGKGDRPPRQVSDPSGGSPPVEGIQTEIYSSSAAGSGDKFMSARAVRVATGAALPDALQLGRALRPLIRYRQSKFIDELDENATAEHSAENGRRVTPVFRPVRERLLDVALVVDDSPAMAVWRKTVSELQSLLERHGAFRDVRRWSLRLAPELSLVSNSGAHVPPRALLDPTGHRLIVLFTQGTHLAWAGRDLAEWLWIWGSKGPLAIAQALPESLWTNTKLGEATATARTLQAAVPNTQLGVERPWWYEPDDPPTLAVPIFALEPEAIARWAQMTMGVRRTPGPALLFELPQNVVDRPANPGPPNPTAKESLSRFEEHASEEAYELACYLSQLQFSLPVMRLVQSALFGSRASQTHLAEVLLSGLVERVMKPDDAAPVPETAERADAESAENSKADAEQVVYRLKADFRTLLRSSAKLDPAFDVIRALTRHIEERLGAPIDFTALVPDARGHYRLPAWAEPFAVAGVALAEQLGLTPRTIIVPQPDEPKPAPSDRPMPSDFQRVRHFNEQPDTLRRIAWSADGRLLAAGSYDGLVRIWEPRPAALRNILSGHTAAVYTVGWSPDSRILASGSKDGTIRIWDGMTGLALRSVALGEYPVLGLGWSPDGQTIACGTDHGAVILVNAATGSRLRDLHQHQGSVHMVAWSPDGELLASASNDGTVAIVNSTTQGVERVLSGLGQLYGLAWSPDGSTLAYCGRVGSIQLADRDGAVSAIVRGHTDATTDLAFSSDGAFLASISWDGTARIWDVHGRTQIAALPVKSGRRVHSGVAFHPGGHSVAVVTDEASAIEIWQPAAERTFPALPTSDEDRNAQLAEYLQSLGLAPEVLAEGPWALAEQLLQSALTRRAAVARHLKLIRAFADSDWVQLLLLREGPLVVVAADVDPDKRGYRYPRASKGLIGRAARTRTAVWAPDVTLESDYIPSVPSTAAEFDIPLSSTDEAATLLGVVNIELPRRNSLSPAQREWLIQFCAPLATLIAESIPALFISYEAVDEDWAVMLERDLLNAGIVASRGQAAGDVIRFADEVSEIDRSIIFLHSRKSAGSPSLDERIKPAPALWPPFRILIGLFEGAPLTLRKVSRIDFRKDYAAGLRELIRTLRPSEVLDPGPAGIPVSEAAEALRHRWHPPDDLDNRGDLTFCSFTLNRNYQKRGKSRWSKWSDVLVDLDDAPNADYVYLLPSRFAPVKFQGRYPLGETDRQQKKALTEAFAETKIGKKLDGYRFSKKMSDGNGRIHVYSREYDDALSEPSPRQGRSPPAATAVDARDTSQPSPSSEAATRPATADDWALVVGINAYAEYPAQSNCVASARAFTQWLLRADGGQVPTAQVTTLLAGGGPGVIGRGLMDRINDEILQLFSNARRERADAHVGRRFYFYVSGLATSSWSGQDLALMMPDASPGLLHRTLPVTKYAQWMSDAGLFDEIVLVADCTTLADLAFEPMQAPFPILSRRAPPTSYFLCWSSDSKGEVSRNVRLLTAAVLAGLAGGAAGPGGAITTSTLMRYLTTELSRSQRNSPEFRLSGEILLRTATAPPAPESGNSSLEKRATTSKKAASKKATRPASKKPRKK
jgi:WD40 repeat protein/putative methionine-R-sulfoxide reductase with GAF domain